MFFVYSEKHYGIVRSYTKFGAIVIEERRNVDVGSVRAVWTINAPSVFRDC